MASVHDCVQLPIGLFQTPLNIKCSNEATHNSHEDTNVTKISFHPLPEITDVALCVHLSLIIYLKWLEKSLIALDR